MEMCYDGALVMPSSYAVMSEEEMTYVEGGWTYTLKKTKSKALSYLKKWRNYYAAMAGISLGLVLTPASTAGWLGLGNHGACLYSYNAAYDKLKEKSWKKVKITEYWTASVVTSIDLSKA